METYVEGSSESRPGKLRAPGEHVGTAEQNRNHVYKELLFCTADPEAALETSSRSRSPENLKGGRKEAAKSRPPRASLVAPRLRTCCQRRRRGFDPWSGRLPQAAEQLGPWATTTDLCSRAQEPHLRSTPAQLLKPERPRARALRQEKPPQ